MSLWYAAICDARARSASAESPFRVSLTFSSLACSLAASSDACRCCPTSEAIPPDSIWLGDNAAACCCSRVALAFSATRAGFENLSSLPVASEEAPAWASVMREIASAVASALERTAASPLANPLNAVWPRLMAPSSVFTCLWARFSAGVNSPATAVDSLSNWPAA